MTEDGHLQRLPFLLYAFNALFSFKAGLVHVRYQTGVDVRGQPNITGWWVGRAGPRYVILHRAEVVPLRWTAWQRS